MSLCSHSSNGTFLNLHRLEKNGAPIRVQHGDVISLVALPDAGQFPPTYTPTDFDACLTKWGPMIWAANAFAYVFVSHSSHKRKPASQGEMTVCTREGLQILTCVLQWMQMRWWGRLQRALGAPRSAEWVLGSRVSPSPISDPCSGPMRSCVLGWQPKSRASISWWCRLRPTSFSMPRWAWGNANTPGTPVVEVGGS